MARKNGNGEGSRPRERADGRWEARYWVGGKRRSVYGSTRKEAADKLAKAIANIEEPRATFAATNITVREFFAQYDNAVRDTMKRRSLETYRDIARLHLLPAFGNKKLKDLTREHVQRTYSQKRDAGLSAARVRRIHGVLSSALNHAVRWRLIDHNVCREVSPPRVPAPEIRPLDLRSKLRYGLETLLQPLPIIGVLPPRLKVRLSSGVAIVSLHTTNFSQLPSGLRTLLAEPPRSLHRR